MKQFKYIKLFFFTIISFFLSCTPKASIKITASNDVFLSVDISPSVATKKLLKSLSSFGADSTFSDEEEDISNITTEDGIEIIKLKKTSSLDFTAKLRFSHSSNLFSSMFSFTKNKLNISINKKNLNTFFANLADEDREYLDLLMAPSLQEISMDSDEYIELIASAYGKKIATELKNSILTLSFEVPSKIKEIEATPKMDYQRQESKASFSIPLTYILVMNEPINISLSF